MNASRRRFLRFIVLALLVLFIHRAQSPGTARAQLLIPSAQDPDIEELIGRWEGVLRFGGEGGRSEHLVTIEVTNRCTETGYCLYYTVTDDPRFTNQEMEQDPDVEERYGQRPCFSHFEGVAGNRIPVTSLCLIQSGPDELEVMGNQPLTGIEGHMTRKVFDCGAVSPISFAECQALVALYQSTGGPAWKNNSGWLANSQPCTWYGINCQMVTGSMTHLMLDDNGLQGPLPPELGNLSLNWLTLADNALEGPLPDAFGNLTVYNLSLRNTALQGPLPLSMANMTSIQTFDFSGTSLCVPSDEAIQDWLQSGALFVSSGLNCDEMFRNDETSQRVQRLLDEKRQLIEYLELPVTPDSDQPLLEFIVNTFDPDWGYDEQRATEVVNRIDERYAQYAAGQLAVEERDAFEAEIEAFHRLVLAERSAEAFYPLAFETSFDVSDTVIDLLGIGLGTMDALHSVPPTPDNPFGAEALQVRARLYSHILSALDSTWELMLNANEDEDLRRQLQDLRQGIVHLVLMRLDAGQSVQEIILDEGLQRYLALVFTGTYLNATQDVLDQATGVASGIGSDGAGITGDAQRAETYIENLNTVVASETDRVHGVHERFASGSNALDIATEIGNLSRGSFVGDWTLVISTVMNTYLEGYRSYCGFSHFAYLKDGMSYAGKYAFDARNALLNIVPDDDHCQPFQWWPDWLSLQNQDAIPITNPASQDGPAVALYIPQDTVASVTALQQAVEALAQADPADEKAFRQALDDYLQAEAGTGAALKLLESSISPQELEDPQILALYRRGRALSHELTSYTMQLLAYLYEPQNADVQNGFAQFGRDLVMETVAFREELAAAGDIPQQDLGGGPRIVAVTLPAPAIVGAEIPVTVTIFNPTAEDVTTAQVVATTGEGLNTATDETLTLTPGYSQHEALTITGVEAGFHLIDLGLVGQDEAVDSRFYAGIDILDESAGDVLSVTPLEGDATAPAATGEAASADATTSVGQSENDATTAQRSWLPLAVLGGGLILLAGLLIAVLVRRQRKRDTVA